MHEYSLLPQLVTGVSTSKALLERRSSSLGVGTLFNFQVRLIILRSIFSGWASSSKNWDSVFVHSIPTFRCMKSCAFRKSRSISAHWHLYVSLRHRRLHRFGFGGGRRGLFWCASSSVAMRRHQLSVSLKTREADSCWQAIVAPRFLRLEHLTRPEARTLHKNVQTHVLSLRVGWILILHFLPPIITAETLLNFVGLISWKVH